MTIYDTMKEKGMKQVDLLFELRKRGIEIQPPELSSILRGVYTFPKAKWILEECEIIVNEFGKG